MISQHHPKSKEKWTQIEVENIFFIGKYDTIILRYSINVEDEIIIYTEWNKNERYW
jgi:hypothetical protein